MCGGDVANEDRADGWATAAGKFMAGEATGDCAEDRSAGAVVALAIIALVVPLLVIAAVLAIITAVGAAIVTAIVTAGVPGLGPLIDRITVPGGKNRLCRPPGPPTHRPRGHTGGEGEGDPPFFLRSPFFFVLPPLAPPLWGGGCEGVVGCAFV